MVYCEICNKEFKSPQGLHGHRQFVHQIIDGQPVAQPDTDQQLSLLYGRIAEVENTLEHLKSARLNDDALTLNENLNEDTEQLKQVSEHLDELDRQYSAMETAKSNSNIHLQQLNKSIEQLSKNIAALEIQADNNKRKLNEAKFTIDKVQTEQLENSNRLTLLEQKLSGLEAALNEVKVHSSRHPTGDVVTLSLKNGKSQAFREYKSSQGLRQPYRVSTDIIFGDKWVDLNEVS
jgi:hypothetical protein